MCKVEEALQQQPKALPEVSEVFGNMAQSGQTFWTKHVAMCSLHCFWLANSAFRLHAPGTAEHDAARSLTVTCHEKIDTVIVPQDSMMNTRL